MTVSSFYTVGEVVQTNATFLSSTAVLCEVPVATLSWQIEVTIDGSQWSEAIVLLNYNTDCFICELTGICNYLVGAWH